MPSLFDLVTIDRIGVAGDARGVFGNDETRKTSDSAFRHLSFGIDSSLGFCHSIRVCTTKVFSRRISGEDFAKKKARIYGVGEASAGDSVVSPVDVDVPVEDSVVEAGLVASDVVVGGLVAAGVAAGSVVSVFCSHAARSAALARMQMYFFIVLIGRGILL
jgi:hypothetical protein